MTMKLAKAFLLLCGVVFIGFGLGFLAVPVQWAAVIDISLPSAMARTDLRATYGGFGLAIGVFWALSAFRAAWIRPGLVALGLAAAGFGGGRLIGILLEGTASPLMLFYLACEVPTAALAFFLVRRLPNTG
jgi:hypothetical protein